MRETGEGMSVKLFMGSNFSLKYIYILKFLASFEGGGCAISEEESGCRAFALQLFMACPVLIPQSFLQYFI